MAKVITRVARKDYPDQGIKKGDTYYQWQLFKQPLRRSKTPPRRSQLTGSEFLGTVYDLEDRIAEAKADDGLPEEIDSIKSEFEQLRDDTQEKLDNMPEGLQQGDTGNLLQERIDALDAVISELDNIDADLENKDNETTAQEWWDEKLAALQDVSIDIS